jgi:hypothetical protein
MLPIILQFSKHFLICYLIIIILQHEWLNSKKTESEMEICMQEVSGGG